MSKEMSQTFGAEGGQTSNITKQGDGSENSDGLNEWALKQGTGHEHTKNDVTTEETPDGFIVVENPPEKDTGDHTEGRNDNTNFCNTDNQGVQNETNTNMEVDGECTGESHLREENNMFKDKITKLQEENSTLRQSLKQSKQRLEDNKKEYEAEKNNVEKGHQELVQGFQTGIDGLGMKNSQLQDQIKKLEDELQEVKEKHNKLLTSNEHLTKTTKEIENQKDTFQKLNEQVVDEIQAVKNDLEKEKSQHLVQVNQLRQQLQDVSKEKDQGMQSLKQSKQRLEDNKKEYEAEKNNVEKGHQELVQGFQTGIDGLGMKNSQLQDQIKKLEDELQEVKEKHNKLLTSMKEQGQRHDKAIKENEVEKTRVEQGYLLANIELNNVNSQQIADINRTKHELQQVKEKRDQLLKRVGEQEHQISTEKEIMTKKENELTEKLTQVKRERDQLSDKLSKEWSDKVASDERHIENVSIQKRPLTIKGDYENLCSNEWLDVKGEIDDVCSAALEETKQGLLCEVFMISEEVCNKQYDKLMKIISTALSSPVKAVSSFKLKSSERSVGVNIKLKSKDKGVQNDDNSSKFETCKESIMKSESKCEGDETNIHSNQNNNKPETNKEGNRTETPMEVTDEDMHNADGTNSLSGKTTAEDMECKTSEPAEEADAKHATKPDEKLKEENPQNQDRPYDPDQKQNINEQENGNRKQNPNEPNEEQNPNGEESPKGQQTTIVQQTDQQNQDELLNVQEINQNKEQNPDIKQHSSVQALRDQQPSSCKTILCYDQHNQNDRENDETFDDEFTEDDVSVDDEIIDIKLPNQLRNNIADYLRGTSDNKDVTQLAHEIRSQLFTDSLLMPLMVTLQENKCFEKYVAVCANLAWNMVIQRPKMNFTREGIGAKWDEKFQVPAYGSDDPKHPDSVVKYYIHPTLMHAQATMVKGTIITKIVQH